MPNVFSCDAAWFERLRADQSKVVVAAWSEKTGQNEWLERLQKLEIEGIPVFVIDCDSCESIAVQVGVKAGETVVFANRRETGRLTPGEDLDKNLGEVREMVK